MLILLEASSEGDHPFAIPNLPEGSGMQIANDDVIAHAQCAVMENVCHHPGAFTSVTVDQRRRIGIPAFDLVDCKGGE